MHFASYNSNYVKDQDYTEETVDGKTVIRFVNTSEPQTLTTYDISFSVKIGTGAAHGDNTVAVTGEYAKDTGAGEDWVDVDLTDGKISVHNWDDGVMTTMPTTTSNGVVTHTCTEEGCSVTKTEDFVVAAGTYGNIVHYSSYYITDAATAKSQYAAAIYNTTYTNIATAGGTATECGIILTYDGSTPVCGTAANLYSEDVNISSGNAIGGYFYGMNLEQMGATLKFRAYVKFTYGTQTCYYYGDIYTTKFIEALGSKTDAQSKALVDLYNAKQTATNITEQCTGSIIGNGSTTIVDYPAYTQLDLLNAKLQYAAAIYNTTYTNIATAGGTATECGIILTYDGSTPVCGTAADLYSEDVNSSAGNAIGGYFYGMNFEQMGATLKFRAFVKYTDSDQNTQYVYGNIVSFKFIDALRGVAGENTYATKLLNYYDTYVATTQN